MSQLNKQQITQVKALFDQWVIESNAKLEASKVHVAVWAEQMKADQFALDVKIGELQQNIEKLQQFYDKFNGEK
jgi:hypothetical protein